MYFDQRDIASNTQKWYESVDETKGTICVKVINGEDPEEIQEQIDFLKQERKMSQEAIDMIDEDGFVEFQMEYQVCPLCDGKGKHVNPSIDAHGITSDEWSEWSYEDREDYMSGVYDVVCYECGEKRVVPLISTSRFYRTKAIEELIEYIDECKAEEASYVHMCMSEKAMGA